MAITPFIRPFFIHRAKVAHEKAMKAEMTQRRELAWMMDRARHTLIGEKYGFSGIDSYEEFRRRVPLAEYSDIRELVMRMVNGEKDILWKGVTRNFAQSSGTSDGKSKYVPITADSFRRNHYPGGADVVAFYLSSYPDSRIFDGKSFILGGSFANELSLPAGVAVGDLSANLIQNINPLVNLVRVPSKEIALMTDWRRKLPALVQASMKEDITNISGVPSWFLTVLKEVVAQAGVDNIHELWQNLEVFFHGGIAFEPYREQYRHITDARRMRYVETYNASEGFFAVQDSPDDHGMLLLLDIGVFYEFIPVEEALSDSPHAVPVWEVEPGRTYALVVTACNGLWRFKIGDTVEVTSVDPVKIRISGRTKHYINAFGEELMVHNADEAIADTCKELGCEIANYTAAPVYAGDRSRGRHEWLIEFAVEPEDMERFADTLDRCLCRVNSDYQAKRANGIFLDRLSVVEARKGLFDDWLASTGKLGGQRKVPRLSNDRHFIDSMLAMNSTDK